MPPRHAPRGFSLIELLVTCAVLAIVAAVAVPNFSQFIRANRVQSAADELYGLILYARSEAVSRGTAVIVQADSADGWMSALTVSTAEDTLRTQDAVNELAGTSDGASIAYRANGTLSSAALAITICDTQNANITGKQIEVQNSGRVAAPVNVECDE